jgi:hypothetical protein
VCRTNVCSTPRMEGKQIGQQAKIEADERGREEEQE